MFSQGAATGRAPALYEDRGIRSMREKRSSTRWRIRRGPRRASRPCPIGFRPASILDRSRSTVPIGLYREDYRRACDRQGLNVAEMNVPAIMAVFGSTADKLGHAGIAAQTVELGKHARQLNLILLEPLAHICRMEKSTNRIIGFMQFATTAATAALALVFIAHYDFGLSRQQIRTPAVVGAGVISALVAVEFFGKKLRKPN
jgi:hypothetical protein